MRNDGGYAFPGFHIDNGVTTIYGGMSMRDALAIATLTGIMSDKHNLVSLASAAAEEGKSTVEKIAEAAYAQADAMLAERDRPKPPLEVTEADREQGATDLQRAYPDRRP